MTVKFKKIFVVLFSICILLAAFCFNASASETLTEGDYQYIIVTSDDLSEDDLAYGVTVGSARITGYTGTTAGISLPATLGGKTVESIGSGAFSGNTAIQTVTIGSTYKVIGSEAFKNCTGLQQVLAAANVTAIYDSAFSGCSGLKSITFQTGSLLTTIGSYAFDGCTSLNNLSLPDGLETIGNYAFRNNDSLISIEIPDSVTSLGGAAFFGCDSMRTAVIGDGVEAITNVYQYAGDNWGTDSWQNGAFEGCISLTSVTIGGSVSSIGQDCFAGSGLTSLSLPDNVLTIGEAAFMNCTSLKTVETGNGLTEIGVYAFKYDTAIESVTIGTNVLTIGNEAFRECDALITITIPSNVTTLGSAAFFHCDSLKTVIIGNGVTSLDTRYNYGGDNWGTDSGQDGTFEGCISLTSVTIGSAVTTIGQDCFAGTALISVNIPDNVITISEGAFKNCTDLTSITIGDGVTSIGDWIFEGDTALSDVNIGSGVISIGTGAFVDCTGLEYIYIPSNVTTLGGAAFFGCDSLTTAVIGNGVTDLNTRYASGGRNWGTASGQDGTFEGCISLTSVTLGSGIISIGQDSFAGTQITTLTVPAKVSTLSDGAFAGATQLSSIYFTGNWPASVGENILSNTAEGITLYYISGSVGYDDLSYNLSTFTPITVTFDNNDSNVFAVTTEEQILSPLGGYVIEPVSPAALGYLFDGWYKDSACTEAWNFTEDEVTSNTTLYAKWNAVDTVVPVRPEGVNTSAYDGASITLTWSAVDGAISYNVYKDSVKVNTEAITATTYTVTGLDSNTTYEFEVTAVNSIGEGEKSIILAQRTSAHVHTFGEWVVTTEATCVADGEQTRTCQDEDCGETETEVIPATGEHTYSEWIVTVEATADSDGTREHTCTVCGYTETETFAYTLTDTEPDEPDAPDDSDVTDEPENPDTPDYSDVTDEPENPDTPDTPNDSDVTDAPNESSYMVGDVNLDGKVTAADARLALRLAAKIEALEGDALLAADLDGNGKVTAAEARKILRVAAQIDVFTDDENE